MATNQYGGDETKETQYYQSDQSYYIPMRDGVRLAIRLYFPEGKVPTSTLPTILIQTREYGLQRRINTTPITSGELLGSQMLSYTSIALLPAWSAGDSSGGGGYSTGHSLSHLLRVSSGTQNCAGILV